MNWIHPEIRSFLVIIWKCPNGSVRNSYRAFSKKISRSIFGKAWNENIASVISSRIFFWIFIFFIKIINKAFYFIMHLTISSGILSDSLDICSKIFTVRVSLHFFCRCHQGFFFLYSHMFSPTNIFTILSPN